MSDNFKILTVCTGNICRSPLAQQILEKEFQGMEQITVESAGVQAMVDQPMPEQSLRIACQNGVLNPDLHRGRHLNEEMLTSADLILAMDRGHRRSIVELSPRVTRKAFTLREFARLIDVTTDADLCDEVKAAGPNPSDKLRAAIEAARLGRSDLLPLENPGEDDVVDPYEKSDFVYEASAQQLIPAVDAVTSYLKRALEME